MAKKQKQKTAAQCEFKKGDLVGARIKGYPLWPGEIIKIEKVGNRVKYTVRFFGGNETGNNFVELKYFKDFTDKERSNTKKGFQEALKICREKYDALNPDDATNIEEEIDQVEDNQPKQDIEAQTSPPHTETPPEIAPDDVLMDESPSVEIKEEPKRDTGLGNGETQTSPQPLASSSSTSSPPRQNEKILSSASSSSSLSPTPPQQHQIDHPLQTSGDEILPRIDSIVDLKSEVIAETTSPITEEKNVMQSSNKIQIVKKLKGKLDAKIKEKEELKQEKMYQKLGEKASKNYPKIEAQLNQISKAFKRLSKFNADRNNSLQWNQAVRRYNCLLPKLEDYIRKYFMTKYSKESREKLECRRALEKIVEELQKAKKNQVLPETVANEARVMLKKMRKNQIIKDFINGTNEFVNSKNAMTERKENDTVRQN